MIPVTTFAGKRVALFGLGGSGLATARALAAGGADLTAHDDNPERVAAARAEGIATGDLRALDWARVEALVLSPGVPLTHPRAHWTVDLARAAGVPVIGDVELFARERRAHAPDCPFVAITGTNGKSTTTALIAHILREAGRDVQLGGNIGTAVLSLEPPEAGRHYVVECSSYQIDLAPTLDPSAGILLNLSPDHLDRHGTMQHYAEIKERLVAGSETAIVGIDDVHSARIAERLAHAGNRVVRISRRTPLEEGFFAEGTRIFDAHAAHAEAYVDLAAIPTLQGSHNAQNAAAAIAACRVVGVDDEAIRAALGSFTGLKHRMQPVARLGDVTFVNDSKATNADAAAPALSTYSRIYWIVGGLPKEGGIDQLSGFFERIAKAYLIGEAAPAFAATLGEAVPYEIAGTLRQAVADAARDAMEDEGGAHRPVVLLSPACASFDQYRNFEERGEDFVAHVAAVAGIEMLVDGGGKER
ncbi:UDP-N-acetylmuramoyl-L-alanine--D-glutamate ligase [Pararhizobium mangrovi]|uniref:UDP-N-acetylmuramoylalanine--D-glutamate ligase n=1 Tax=Pararhizobium mangrovi TaxID=2590452 RepID=A0A506U6Z9_9HYPH|nr:UDP-N-acetylmuramoyl-L-alanine--D-glutamate ligase [Pararhizobium mangrovi]TPW29278.1 UDP-N-acetylmuramoyl-L-alanine--D-glutamate ligase [Pararhizobium mangrovi]